jgi:hypothetical protein
VVVEIEEPESGGLEGPVDDGESRFGIPSVFLCMIFHFSTQDISNSNGQDGWVIAESTAVGAQISINISTRKPYPPWAPH